jgi:hypothetical protein
MVILGIVLQDRELIITLIVIQNDFPVLLDGKFETTLLVDFVASNKLPLIIPFSKDTSSLIFESPIKRQVARLS